MLFKSKLQAVLEYIESYGSESIKLFSIVVKLFLDHNERSLDITLINQPFLFYYNCITKSTVKTKLSENYVI